MGGDLFEELFGGFAGGARGQNVRGDDIQTTLNISFLEACKGTKKKVNITPITDCKTCSGSGLKAGTSRNTCTACNGTGTRTFVIDSGFQMASTCNECRGEGQTIPRGGECSTCAGVGKVRTKQTVDVVVPAGGSIISLEADRY